MMNRQLAQKPLLLCSNSADSNPSFSAQIQLILTPPSLLKFSWFYMQLIYNLAMEIWNTSIKNLFFSNC